MRSFKYQLLLPACVLAVSATATPSSKFISVGSDHVKDEYIVVLSDDVRSEQVSDVTRELVADKQVKIKKLWRYAVKGFVATMPRAQAEAISRSAKVRFVEENAEWSLSAAQQTNVDPRVCNPINSTCPPVVDNRLWHLDRIDQTEAAPNNLNAYCSDGTGVTVYVVDTGVNKFHQEFAPDGVRVRSGYNASGDLMPADDPCVGFAVAADPGSPLETRNFKSEWQGAGHGTAVASMVGGTRSGVAKNVTIVPVKTARCDKYSARLRLSNHFYRQYETMVISNDGSRAVAYFRARNAGFTAGTDPGAWPVSVGSIRLDGGVQWEVIDTSTVQTTEMLGDGLDWILSPQNPNPKAHSVVTMSTFRLVEDDPAKTGYTGSIEIAIRNLLANDITVIASANNQNGNACDTTPARMSRNNPNSAIAADVITVGGSMIINQPWGVDISDVPGGFEADGDGKGQEPPYDASQPVRDGRWICWYGDSSHCSNSQPTESPSPTLTTSSGYTSFQGGSNAGPCVTVFAPAKNIFVATITGPSDYRDARVRGGQTSGTSWSAPIVAGYAARILQYNAGLTPPEVRAIILQNSVSTLDPATLDSRDHLGYRIEGTPNKLLRLGDVNIIDQPDSIEAAGPVEVNVVAAGTASLSYQWFRVNEGFDLTVPYGAHSSVAIDGATGSTFLAPVSSQPVGYWVRVTGPCGSADSRIAVVSPAPLSPPSGFVAVRSIGGVKVSWTPVAGATGYEVFAKVAGAPWSFYQPTQSTTIEMAAASNGVAVYRVRATAATGYSGFSNQDIAFGGSFTDEPIVVDHTPLRAVHVVELRQAVNSLRAAIDLAPAYVGDEVLVSALRGREIQASMVLRLLDDLNTARAAVALEPIALDGGSAAGTLIEASDMERLRSGVQ